MLTNDLHNENIFHLPFKAEAVCASLMESGLDYTDIVTSYLGTFKKVFSSDISHFEIEEGLGKKVNMFLNRNSIYDVLPEGLFHQSRGINSINSVSDAVAEHKRYKEEERDARKFFAPVEQAMFQFSLLAELEECKIRSTIYQGQFSEAFCNFWNIDPALPTAYRNRMLDLMPYASFIKCNKEATLTSLEYILDTKIVFESGYKSTSSNKKALKDLNQIRLGIDSQLGNSLEESFPCWTFFLSNIKEKDLYLYIEGQPLNDILVRFTEIFLPFYVDVEFQFEKEENKSETNHQYVLGYSATL